MAGRHWIGKGERTHKQPDSHLKVHAANIFAVKPPAAVHAGCKSVLPCSSSHADHTRPEPNSMAGHSLAARVCPHRQCNQGETSCSSPCLQPSRKYDADPKLLHHYLSIGTGPWHKPMSSLQWMSINVSFTVGRPSSVDALQPLCLDQMQTPHS